MKSMRMTAEEAKDYYGPATSSSADAPLYPYGLCVSLNDATVKKLGIALPAVGTKMVLTAIVEVNSVRQHKEQGGDTNTGVELQITEMELQPETKEIDAKSLYPNSSHT